jgi:ankyrin repeat protein
MSPVRHLHEAVRRGDLAGLETLLAADRELANSLSETDARGTYPLHVAAEHGGAEAARLLLRHGADAARLDRENDAIPLCWAAFFGRPAVVAVLVEHGSALDQRNKHGLTPLGCALGGTRGEWRQFSDASIEDWARCVELLRARGARE